MPQTALLPWPAKSAINAVLKSFAKELIVKTEKTLCVLQLWWYLESVVQWNCYVCALKSVTRKRLIKTEETFLCAVVAVVFGECDSVRLLWLLRWSLLPRGVCWGGKSFVYAVVKVMFGMCCSVRLIWLLRWSRLPGNVWWRQRRLLCVLWLLWCLECVVRWECCSCCVEVVYRGASGEDSGLLYALWLKWCLECMVRWDCCSWLWRRSERIQ
jgi:hypothetical protein